MTIRNTIETILNEYLGEKSQPIKNNALAKLLRNGLSEDAEDLFTENIVSFGSAGKGNWATSPWIGVFDTDITRSAVRGFYIVYLFSSDMSRVYLSLNQGWTFFHETYEKNAKKRIKDVAKIFQNTLTVQNGHMTDNGINLLGPSESNTLVTGYELGNIFSIEYSAKHLPSNEIMKQDLADMLASLKAVKDSLVDDSNIGQSIEYILSVNDRQTLYLDKGDKKIAKELTKVDLVETEAPATKEKALNRRVTKRQGRKSDYAQGQQNNSELGFFGEKAVLKFEKERLQDYPELVKKIEQVSVTQGDGLGYDILSFDKDGNELYIEVKTTKQGKETPFYISSNEVDFAKTHPENYVLYRLYNADKAKMNESDVKFFRISGKNFADVVLSPTNYQASF